MALPILGDISNIYSISRDMVTEYHHNNYFGENLIIVATGSHDHNEFCNIVNDYFGKFSKKSP